MTERNPFETVKRKPLTTLQRAKLFADHNGICVICKTKIFDGKRFIDEHIKPLSQGGTNTLNNRGPAHEWCATDKTSQDATDLSTIRNGYANRVGAKRSKCPLMGSRDHPSGLRRKMNGEVVKW